MVSEPLDRRDGINTKAKIEWFEGKEDFTLWRQWMRAILVQMKVAKALKGKDSLLAELGESEKEDVMDWRISPSFCTLGTKF